MIVVNRLYYAFVTLACFLGISQNAGTLPELNVYRTENPCITNLTFSYKLWFQVIRSMK